MKHEAVSPRGALCIRRSRRGLKCSGIALLLLITQPIFGQTSPDEPFRHTQKTELTVVSDDNYPPYIFRDSQGKVRGYLVDVWSLWEKKTGIPVKLLASDWDLAQQRMKEGKADVIDTIFKTEERQRTLDFTPPYAQIPVAIYTHSRIGGIADISTLRGFLVGVKAGDACIGHLENEGIRTLQTYPSYEALVRAATRGDVRVFCLDEPPANYLLYRDQSEDDIRMAFRLYSGEFHRAVKKGDTTTLKIVNEGFSLFSPSEIDGLRNKWLGTPIASREHIRFLGYAFLAALATGGLLLLWIFTLRQVVRQRTEDLRATLNAIPDLLFETDLEGRYYRCPKQRDMMLTTPSQDILGNTVRDVMPPEPAQICLEALEEAHQKGHSCGYQIELDVPLGRRWFELSVARKGNPDDKDVRFIILSRDITERRQAESMLRAQKKQLQIISRASQNINAILDTPMIMKNLITAALDATGAKSGMPGLMQNGVMVFTDFYSDRQSLPVDYRFTPGFGIAGRVMETHAPYLSNDILNDPFAIPDIRESLGVINVLGTPVLSRNGEMLGCFEIFNKPEGFDETDIQLLQGLSASAAIALENSNILAGQKCIEKALRESELLKSTVLSSTTLAIVAIDPVGIITVFNSGAENLLGYAAEEVIGKKNPLIFHDIEEIAAYTGTRTEDINAKSFDVILEKAHTTGRPDEREWTYIRRDGQRVPVSLSVTTMRSPQGNIMGYLGIATDITERKKTAIQLELASRVFEQSSEGLIISDAERRIVMVNQAFTRISGYTEQEAIGQNTRMLASGRHDADFYHAMWSSIESKGYWQGELWNRKKDGSIYPVLSSISRVSNKTGKITNYLATFIDITKQKEAEEAIRQLAHFDLLTGLPNRALLNARIDYMLERSKRNHEQFTLMFLDLDRFKNVNDTLGHLVGDELLKQVAQRLRSALRDEDTVSRLGGDEFILLLPGTDKDGASRVATKLLEVTTPPYLIDKHELACTTSIGIAIYPTDGENFEALSMSADTAMYGAKKAGRNGYCFFSRDEAAHQS